MLRFFEVKSWLVGTKKGWICGSSFELAAGRCGHTGSSVRRSSENEEEYTFIFRENLALGKRRRFGSLTAMEVKNNRFEYSC